MNRLMNAIQHRTFRVTRIAYRALIAALLMGCMLLTPSAAMARKKKEEASAPTKSYVLPYFIVMTLLGVGLMTVCRPGTRKDRVDEKMKKDEY